MHENFLFKQRIEQFVGCPRSLHLPSYTFWLFQLPLIPPLLWGGGMEDVGMGDGEGGNTVREDKVQISELCFLCCFAKKRAVGSSRFYCLQDYW